MRTIYAAVCGAEDVAYVLPDDRYGGGRRDSSRLHGGPRCSCLQPFPPAAAHPLDRGNQAEDPAERQRHSYQRQLQLRDAALYAQPSMAVPGSNSMTKAARVAVQLDQPSSTALLEAVLGDACFLGFHRATSNLGKRVGLPVFGPRLRPLRHAGKYP